MLPDLSFWIFPPPLAPASLSQGHVTFSSFTTERETPFPLRGPEPTVSNKFPSFNCLDSPQANKASSVLRPGEKHKDINTMSLVSAVVLSCNLLTQAQHGVVGPGLLDLRAATFSLCLPLFLMRVPFLEDQNMDLRVGPGSLWRTKGQGENCWRVSSLPISLSPKASGVRGKTTPPDFSRSRCEARKILVFSPSPLQIPGYPCRRIYCC